jgi:hypothetical protein
VRKILLVQCFTIGVVHLLSVYEIDLGEACTGICWGVSLVMAFIGLCWRKREVNEKDGKVL